MSGTGQLVHPGRMVLSRPASAGPLSHAPSGPVLYWMHREHRFHDNWALLHALDEATRRKVPCAVVYGLAPAFLGACIRQFGFLLRGLRETAASLEAADIPFILLRDTPDVAIPEFAAAVDAAYIVTDFDSLRLKRQWIDRVRQTVSCPVAEVDSRNVVPCRMASDKREYAARTIRPKIHRLLDEYVEPFPVYPVPPIPWRGPVTTIDWDAVHAGLGVDRSVPEVSAPYGPEPGEKAARKALNHFLTDGILRYEQRNDPNADAVSGLSPYLHFGMLSAQRVVLDTLERSNAGRAAGRQMPAEAREVFLEELVVRRELADNFCLHTPHYDRCEAFPDWARKTLDKHAGDPREYLYDIAVLEQGNTHDPLWNAAQAQMRLTGTMHGYLRMYWAKKILEWTSSAEEAMGCAIYLNDRYFLDGRDANGYTGVAWSMGGVHDRPWGERAIFGTIRYMNFAGAKRKFDVAAFVRSMEALEQRMRGQGLV